MLANSPLRTTEKGCTAFLYVEYRLVVDGGDSLDVLIGEDIQLVEGRGGELGDNGLGIGREPVTSVGSDGILLAGIEHDLVEDGVAGVLLDGMAVVVGRGLTLNVQVNLTVTATEGLLLTDVVLLGQGSVDVLGAGHAGQQNHLLTAVAIGVDVGNQQKTGVINVVQTEVSDLDVCQLVGVHNDTSLSKNFRSLLACDLNISLFHDIASFL